MIKREFFKKYEEDDRFISYHPIKPIKIFGFDLDMHECEINISLKIAWEEAAPILTQYLDWLASCKDEVTGYFISKLEEALPEGWYGNIEVYNASITFITLEDFGATVSFGESIFPDHIIEFHFDKFEIVDVMLNG